MSNRIRKKPVVARQYELSQAHIEDNSMDQGGLPDMPNEGLRPDNRHHNNRAKEVSKNNDKTATNFYLGLETIDEAIFYYFDNVIRPFVYQNGQRIAVPVIYGSPERWKAVQKDGYYRDKNGKIMSPIIMIKRNNLTKNRNITNKLDANFPHLYTSWQKSYNPSNFYSNFNALNNRVQTKQFVANVVPDYVTITYDVSIQTYYMEQLNKIVEACEYASDSYWGNPERFKFMSRIDSFNTVNEINQGEERSVRSTFTINMYGYIVPDVIQKDLSAVKKYNSRSKIIFSMETTSDPKVFNPDPQVATDGRNRLPENVNTRRRLNEE